MTHRHSTEFLLKLCDRIFQSFDIQYERVMRSNNYTFNDSKYHFDGGAIRFRKVYCIEDGHYKKINSEFLRQLNFMLFEYGVTLKVMPHVSVTDMDFQLVNIDGPPTLRNAMYILQASPLTVPTHNAERIDNNKLIHEGHTTFWHDGSFAHREDGPAVYSQYSEQWFWHGLLHREDGPAYRKHNCELWYKYGVQHREDGPAAIRERNNIKIEEFWFAGKPVNDIKKFARMANWDDRKLANYLLIK